ncbi:hypothetical protein BH09BAC1_BH09BAC1_18870 [soil metagenome]
MKAKDIKTCYACCIGLVLAKILTLNGSSLRYNMLSFISFFIENYIVKKATFLLLLCCLFNFLPKAQAYNPPASFMVEYKLLYSYTQDSLDRFWKANKIPQILMPVENAVDMYEISYKGLWLDSSFVLAKGVLYVPKSEKPLAEMVYCHGTRISVDQSYGIQDLEQVVTMMHAADGYISYFPFYYGLGGGEKEHIYHDAFTEAMSVIYMVKACREIFPALNVKTSGQLFVTGYSQGGHAAMATHKMLETGAFPDVQITASSPMAGAYDLTGVQAKTMFIEYDRPHYLPYLLISYQYAYHMWEDDIYTVFKSPYDVDMARYFALPRVFDYGYLDSVLPRIPKNMVIDSLISIFQTDTNFIFTAKLRENNLYNWTPIAPMQLCACYGDNEVLYQNTEKAYSYMKPNAPRVTKRIFGKHLSHNPCAPLAMVYTKTYFNNIRKGKKKPEKVGFGKGFIMAIGIAQANKQAKKHKKSTGQVEDDPMAARKKK